MSPSDLKTMAAKRDIWLNEQQQMSCLSAKKFLDRGKVLVHCSSGLGPASKEA